MGVPVFDMLRFLSVRHLAVIDQLEVEFEPGLNVLTGETGAGKSMLVEAIDLLVGGRASADLVRTGEDLATVQAIFERPDGREVIVRREISAQGRSRAFIDDALATTAALRDLGAAPASICTASTNIRRCSIRPSTSTCSTRSRDYGERVADVGARIRRVAERGGRARSHAARRAREARAHRDRVVSAAGDRQGRAARPAKTSSSAAERPVLANADRLSRLSSRSVRGALRGRRRGAGALGRRLEARRRSRGARPALRPYLDAARRRSSRGSRTSRSSCAATRADLDASPERLQAVEDRLAALERLKRKYGPALADVLARQAALREELAALEASDERAAALERAASRTRARSFSRAARDVSRARATAGARARPRARARRSPSSRCRSRRVDVRVTTARTTPEQWTRRGHRRRRVLLLAEPGRGPAAARAHRLGRRALAHHARAPDARRARRAAAGR